MAESPAPGISVLLTSFPLASSLTTPSQASATRTPPFASADRIREPPDLPRLIGPLLSGRYGRTTDPSVLSRRTRPSPNVEPAAETRSVPSLSTATSIGALTPGGIAMARRNVPSGLKVSIRLLPKSTTTTLPVPSRAIPAGSVSIPGSRPVVPQLSFSTRSPERRTTLSAAMSVSQTSSVLGSTTTPPTVSGCPGTMSLPVQRASGAPSGPTLTRAAPSVPPGR